MDEYSRLSGNADLSRIPDKVWNVEKKLRVGDRAQRDKKRQGKKGEERSQGEEDGIRYIEETASENGEEAVETEEVGYGSTGVPRRLSRKVDLVI